MYVASKTAFLFFLLTSPIVLSAQQLKDKAFLTGHYNYRTDTGFIKVPAAYCNKETYLQKQTYAAFNKMREAALKYGVTLTIVSGTRSFDDQNGIWTRKWNKLQSTKMSAKEKVLDILKWSSMPGSSRHHWGTDMDLNSTEPDYFTTPNGQKVYKWLFTNAGKYGFAQPYTAGRTTGYKEEKWHWSYLPLSKSYLSQYSGSVTYADLTGIKGYEVAPEISIIKNWVMAINPACK